MKTRIVEFIDGTFGVERTYKFLFWTMGSGEYYSLRNAELLYSHCYIQHYAKTEDLNTAKVLQQRVEKIHTDPCLDIKRVVND